LDPEVRRRLPCNLLAGTIIHSTEDIVDIAREAVVFPWSPLSNKQEDEERSRMTPRFLGEFERNTPPTFVAILEPWPSSGI
jgi:hypothetical protein